ncbi:MAG: YdgA family protein [Gammaproteobacteria bacterium]|nr:YdgA family protein [Gammaproteobacteria bacterium]
MKKSVIALILLAVLIIIVSPGIVGKLAENSVGENLNWAAEESGELVVTTTGFDRGWFVSEGQHRVELKDGSIRSLLSAAASDDGDATLPVLLINTRIDHGLVPITSMSREQGSLAPGLGSAVSTLSVELGPGESIALPGTIYSKVGLGGGLESRYIVDAGARTVDDGEVTWEPIAIDVTTDPRTGRLLFDGKVGAMTFGNDQQVVAIDGLSIKGQQTETEYGFHVGDVDLSMGTMKISAGGIDAGGMQGLTVKGASSVNAGKAEGAGRLEISGQQIPGFGDMSVIADLTVGGLDAEALGAVSEKFRELSGQPDPALALAAAEGPLKGLVAAGFNMRMDQFDVGLPMGTVEMKMTIDVPESDRATFEWSSLLLQAESSLYISVPETLVQFAASMDPQVGAIVGLGYLKKEGAVYIMDADMKKGLLTINGAPIPIPLGAFQ